MKIPQEVLTTKTFDLSYNVNEGVCKFNRGNTKWHEIAKAIIMFNLMSGGDKVYSEVIFEFKKGIADLVNASKSQINEVLFSETLEQARRKENYYPFSLLVEYHEASDIIDQFVKEWELYKKSTEE